MIIYPTCDGWSMTRFLYSPLNSAKNTINKSAPAQEISIVPQNNHKMLWFTIAKNLVINPNNTYGIIITIMYCHNWIGTEQEQYGVILLLSKPIFIFFLSLLKIKKKNAWIHSCIGIDITNKKYSMIVFKLTILSNMYSFVQRIFQLWIITIAIKISTIMKKNEKTFAHFIDIKVLLATFLHITGIPIQKRELFQVLFQ